jgi:localization factor PodJL
MTSGVSVKTAGVRPEALAVAREAARRSGVSVTHWLNAAIIETANEDELAAGDEDRAGPDRQAQQAPAPDDLEPLAAREATVAPLGPTQPDWRADAPAPNEAPASAATDWSADLDRALSEIAARQRALEIAPRRHEKREAALPPGDSPTSVELARFEQQLRRLTEEIEALRRPGALDSAMAAVQHDLRAVAYTLTDALPSRMLAAFQTQIDSLAERLAAERLDGRTLAGLERRLAEVRAALAALPSAERFAGLCEELRALSRQVESLGANRLDADALRPLETAIADLSRVVARSPSNEALVAVRSDINALGSRLEPPAAAAPAIDQLAQRIEALTARVDANSAQARSEIPDRIETVLRSLSERFEAIRPSGPDPAGFEALEQRIMGLAQKLDDADGGHVAAIEGRMVDLIDDLKEAHALALETAQSTTRSITREVLAAHTATGEEVDALRHDVSALSSAQTDIDRRTAGTLEAIHDTLARLLERMAAIETEISVPPEGRGPADTGGSTLGGAGGVGPNRWAEPPPLTPARRAGDPPHPLEPGLGPTRRATPAERIAASEAALASKTAQPADAKATFIAAARRAARAAASLEDAPAKDPDPEASGGRPGAIASLIAKHRGTLILAAAGAALLVGAVHFLSGFVGSSDAVRLDSLRPIPNALTLPPADTADAVVAPLPDPPSDPMPANPGRRSQGKSDEDALLSPIPSPGIDRDVVGALATAPRSEPTPQAPAVAAPAPMPPTDPGLTPSGVLPAAIGGTALRAAAASENPAAEFEVALRYAEGRGVPQSFEMAARWFERAADHGLAPAQFRLGCLYEKGQGVKKDLETARRLYLTAADRGHAKAMHNLAVLYAEGIDGKPDYKTASQWFRKAADHGVPDSQFNLGILYARGIGVEQNLPESYKWFSLAALQGDQDAAKKRDEVALRLDPQALVAARLATQTFTVDPQPEDAITVATPPGGWDRPIPARPKASLPRRLGTSPPAPDRG